MTAFLSSAICLSASSEVIDCSPESAFAVVGRAGEAGLAERAKALEAKITAREGHPCRSVSVVPLPADEAAARQVLFDYGKTIRRDAAIRRIGILATPAVYAFATNAFAYNFKYGEHRNYPLPTSCRADVTEFAPDAALTEAILDRVCGCRVDLAHPMCEFQNGEAPLAPAEAVAALEAGGWIDRAMAKTRTRIDAWRGTDEVVLVAFICDLHSYSSPLARWESRTALTNGTLCGLKRFAYVANRFGCDAAADLGDMGYDYSRRHWMLSCLAERTPRIALQQACYDLIKGPFLAVPGNHDGHWRAPDGFGQAFNPASAKRTQGIEFGPTRTYGYLDLAGKRTRLVFVDTSEGGKRDGLFGGGNRISAEQVEFLRKAVRTTPDGWAVGFFSHECVHRTAGHKDWKASPWTDQPGYRDIRSLLESIPAEGRLRLAGIWCGDSHFNRRHDEKGVSYFVCDAAFKVRGDGRLLVHIAAINPRTGEGRLFRVGANDKKGEL